MFQVVLAKERASVYVSRAGSHIPGETMDQLVRDIEKLQRLVGLLALQMSEMQQELRALERGTTMDYENVLDRLRLAEQHVIVE
jgi:hypothetical protein